MSSRKSLQNSCLPCKVSIRHDQSDLAHWRDSSTERKQYGLEILIQAAFRSHFVLYTTARISCGEDMVIYLKPTQLVRAVATSRNNAKRFSVIHAQETNKRQGVWGKKEPYLGTCLTTRRQGYFSAGFLLIHFDCPCSTGIAKPRSVEELNSSSSGLDVWQTRLSCLTSPTRLLVCVRQRGTSSRRPATVL